MLRFLPGLALTWGLAGWLRFLQRLADLVNRAVDVLRPDLPPRAQRGRQDFASLGHRLGDLGLQRGGDRVKILHPPVRNKGEG